MLMRDPVNGEPVDPEKTEFKTEIRGKEYFFCSQDCMNHFLEAPKIAYFSMEVGIRNDIPTYSGGLGVLAGDTIRSSADLRLPMVAVTLVSRKGYLKQKISENGEQIDLPDEWKPEELLELMPQMVKVKIGKRDVRIRSWLYDYKSQTGGVVPLLFLDTDIEENHPEDQAITDHLYGGDERYRFKQEIVLGIGGTRILDALNFSIRKYHMNEGHSSLLTLELLRKNGLDAETVNRHCIFTTHTPIEAAFDKFSYDMVNEFLGQEFPIEELKKYGGKDKLNMTLLALNLSRYENGVTKAHMEHSKKLFPGHHIHAVTNGVHSYTWTCQYFKELFDRYIPGWANEPELLVRVDEVPDEEIWRGHLKAKKILMDFINEQTTVQMDISALTLGFARRATGYKRTTLIFSDLERLKDLAKKRPLQLVFAGKAHPRDITGKQVIKQIYKYREQLKDQIKIVYLENYDMDLAAKLISGVDVWLNTPLPPLEASGTSGMKAAHNGVINFSILDGWWLEGCIEGTTGWAIGPSPKESIQEAERRKLELEDLYNKTKYIIIPKFYRERDEWIKMMKNSIGKIAYYFNTERMMRRYITEAYLT